MAVPDPPLLVKETLCGESQDFLAPDLCKCSAVTLAEELCLSALHSDSWGSDFGF